MKNVYVLGISALYHNSAAALICNGRIVAAAEEERFTRIKGDSDFPINAISFCLDSADIQAKDLDHIVYYEDTAEKFGRIITSSFLCTPKSVRQFLAAMPEWISDKLWVEKEIRKQLGLKKSKVIFLPHHISHAASAFYPSPFEDAAILTMDGVGEWTTTAWGTGEKENLVLKGETRFPNSLGLLYSAFTFYTGFKINNGEYKMMGLAPYGEPKYADLIKKELVKIGEDGSIALNQKYFSYTYGVTTITPEFEKLFGAPARKKDEEITSFHADIAASIQEVTNEILLTTAKYIRKVTGKTRLCMAGGVALNVTATGLLRKSKIFDDIWIQPAAGDAGGAIGAALYTYYKQTGDTREIEQPDSMQNSFLGYEISDTSEDDDNALKALGGVWTTLENEEISQKIAELVADNKIVGVAHGKAEFGPRALGHRSILADARQEDMLQRLNAKIKFREGFRPFAPAVLEEDAKEYFDIDGISPYMIFTFPVKGSRRLPIKTEDSVTKTASLARSDIPTVTHIDYSARIQTVSKETNPFFHEIIKAFKSITGCSVMVNTSYNVNQEPIVNNAVDAYKSFMKSGIDYAVIGNRIFDKKQQPSAASKGVRKNAEQ